MRKFPPRRISSDTIGVPDPISPDDDISDRTGASWQFTSPRDCSWPAQTNPQNYHHTELQGHLKRISWGVNLHRQVRYVGRHENFFPQIRPIKKQRSNPQLDYPVPKGKIELCKWVCKHKVASYSCPPLSRASSSLLQLSPHLLLKCILPDHSTRSCSQKKNKKWAWASDSCIKDGRSEREATRESDD